MKMILPMNNFSRLCVFLCLFAAASGFAAPRVECDEATFDFGTLIGQDELIHEFTVWNRGDSELKIQKVRACCGMKASMDSMTIAPGSNATCHVVFDLSTRRGEQNKQVWLATNDPEHPYLDLRLVGTHKAAVDVQPARIRFGKLLAGGESVQTVTATNLLTNAVSLLSVSTSAKGFGAEVVESADRSWVIEVTASPEAATDHLSGSVELNFSSGTERVYVSGSVVPAIQSVPERIVLLRQQSKVGRLRSSSYAEPRRSNVEGGSDKTRMSEDGCQKSEVGDQTSDSGNVEQASQPAHGQTGMSAPQVSNAVKRLVMLSGNEPFTVCSAELEGTEGEVSFNELRPDRWRCSITVSPADIRSGAFLLITTDSPAQPEIKIPLVLK